jgi:hypothetical protein
MNKQKLAFLISVTLLFTLIIASVYAEGDEKNKPNSISKTLGTPVRSFMDINSIFTVIKNDGISDIDVNEQNSGLVYPKGSGKTAVFQSGFLWGAKVPGDNQVRVGGTAYRTGLQGGKILDSGLPYTQLTAEDPNADNVRIYRVRPDVYPEGPTVDLSQDAVYEFNNAQALRTQYETDWNEWPAEDGAPFDDVDGDGIYDPAVDIPGVLGADQTIWFVANDLDPSRTQFMYGANPLGIEMQATLWAYAQSGPLGSMFFRQYKIINKTDTPFDSMYVSMWSDVDLGNSTDDFAGCDTTLSLGFCYNANAVDATYNPLPPPAVGFDFFQGPVSDGDTLGMTAYYYFARGDPSVTDPTQGDIQGSNQFYNFLRGRIGLTGQIFTDPNGRQTTFALDGDPQTGTGWLDGQILPSGDRRIGSASGPFTMEPGDTQTVVVAEIVAGAIPGVDRISAIGLLKYYDQFAQFAYDVNFDLPVPPPAPEVNVAGSGEGPINNVYYGLDKKIVLDWGESLGKVSATENYSSKGHTFQGYNVYQLPSAASSFSEATRIATYDIADGVLKIFDDVFDPSTGSVVNLPVQFGNDTEIRRYLEITTDAISGGTPLINGIRYYFAVTAYSYNPEAPVGKTLETPLRILTIVPRSKNPGQVFSDDFADTLTATHNLTPAEGASDGNVYPIVIDPTKVTGLSYVVSFDTLNGGVVWNLDRSDGVRVLSNQTNQNADAESPITDGIQWRVVGAPLDFKGFDMTSNAGGQITGAECTYELTQIGTDNLGISADWYRDVALSTNGGALSGCVPEPEMQLAGGYFFCVAGDETIGDHDAAVGRWARDGANFSVLIPNNYEIRWTGDHNNSAGKGWMAFSTGSLVDVPFSLWFLGPNLDDLSDDVRMMPWIFDDNENDLFDFKLDHEASGGDNDPYSDWIYFMMPNDHPQPGEQDYNDLVTAMTPDPTGWPGEVEVEHIARFVIMNWNQLQGDGGEDEWPEQGTTFRIRMTIPNAAGVDEFTINTTAAAINTDKAKTEINKINVFPNPYYGVNSEEINKYNRFVTFSHLPNKATIRIFNLAGVLVRKIEKDDQSQFQRWDLANEYGLPVASGLYIAYIDMPDLGKTTILKLAIIQEQQILDRF